MKTLSANKLFTPIQVGRMKLEHRVVMAPLTRSRSVQPGSIPGDLMLEYHSQRADGGLIGRRRSTSAVSCIESSESITNVPGISAITAQASLCEIGTDVSRFRNASAFASWLGLCPENKISGGKVLYTKSRRVRSRVATALRMAANSLHHAKDYLGEFFPRITRKLGKPQAITATAHKLARIVYHLLSAREAYNESVFHRCDEEAIKRAQYRLRKQAAQLGFEVIPLQNR